MGTSSAYVDDTLVASPDEEKINEITKTIYSKKLGKCRYYQRINWQKLKHYLEVLKLKIIYKHIYHMITENKSQKARCLIIRPNLESHLEYHCVYLQ